MQESYIEITIHYITEVSKLSGVDKERWHEIYISVQIWVSCKLILPTVWNAPLSKIACFPSERGDKRT